MKDEAIKAALITLGLKEDASLTDIRAAYLAKTSQDRFQQVILGDEHLEKDFVRYYKTYIMLLKHYSELESATLTDYPQDQIVTYLFNQGLFYLINQNYLKAMEKFQEAHKLDKKDVLVLLYMGILLMKRKNHYAAEKYFQDALDIDPQCEDAWFYLGENYLKAGEHRKALLMFESVRRLNPSRKGLIFKINEIKEKISQSSSAEERNEKKKPSLFKRIFKKRN
ncbi:MAG TPA: tetratricopeptide repeat protein [Candidatus Kapabacteria bacterium]|nr:tetratricopeptide repeat protein [Candidatus Kapabacteria bacterium]